MNIDVKGLEANEELRLAIFNMNEGLTKVLNNYLKQDSNNLIETDKLSLQELSIDTINYEVSTNGPKLNVIVLTKLDTGNPINFSINFYNRITSSKNEDLNNQSQGLRRNKISFYSFKIDCSFKVWFKFSVNTTEYRGGIFSDLYSKCSTKYLGTLIVHLVERKDKNMYSNNRTFGLARVSSKDQNEARQLEALREFGVEDKYIYVDKESGKDFNREQYQILKSQLRENDLLVIKSIDRLGRDYDMIIEEWRDITKNIKADIFVIDMPLLHTRTNKDLLGTFISDLVLQILSYVANQERLYIKTRQREGIDIALAKGVKFGRVPKTKEDLENNPQFLKYYMKWKRKEITLCEMQRLLGVKSRTTCYNWIKLIEKGSL